MRIDLHAHSTRSDGTRTPAELVADARRAHLDAVAITDHDTTSGWLEATAAAHEHGITLVSGVEISCERDGRSVHLLGYLVDPSNTPLRPSSPRPASPGSPGWNAWSPGWRRTAYR